MHVSSMQLYFCLLCNLKHILFRIPTKASLKIFISKLREFRPNTIPTSPKTCGSEVRFLKDAPFALPTSYLFRSLNSHKVFFGSQAHLCFLYLDMSLWNTKFLKLLYVLEICIWLSKECVIISQRQNIYLIRR